MSKMHLSRGCFIDDDFLIGLSRFTELRLSELVPRFAASIQRNELLQRLNKLEKLSLCLSADRPAATKFVSYFAPAERLRQFKYNDHQTMNETRWRKMLCRCSSSCVC